MFRLTGLAIVDHRLGNREEAQRSFDKSQGRKNGDAALYQQAEVLAQLGTDRRGTSPRWSGRVPLGDSGLIYLSTDPMLDPIRRQPRFTQTSQRHNIINLAGS